MSTVPRIQTPRLLLRAFERTDAADVQRLAGHRDIADTTLNIPHPYEDGMAEAWIETHRSGFAAGELAIFAIVHGAGDELVGAMGLTIEAQSERAELGYWIGRPFWGRGYCTEAGLAVIECGFTELGLNRIHATHFSRNPASGRVMQKIGMVHEGRAPQHARKWGRFEDMERYGLLRQQWSAIHQPSTGR